MARERKFVCKWNVTIELIGSGRWRLVPAANKFLVFTQSRSRRRVQNQVQRIWKVNDRRILFSFIRPSPVNWSWSRRSSHLNGKLKRKSYGPYEIDLPSKPLPCGSCTVSWMSNQLDDSSLCSAYRLITYFIDWPLRPPPLRRNEPADSRSIAAVFVSLTTRYGRLNVNRRLNGRY